MSAFPALKTGVVAQHPSDRALTFATHEVQFLDGSAQRFRNRAAALRRWVIRLDLLDEQELARLEEFFLEQGGRAGSFSFTDPWDGADYPNCSFEDDDADFSMAGPQHGRAEIAIRQNWS
jgi:hypothetical protein